jgi:hypothetical protein
MTDNYNKLLNNNFFLQGIKKIEIRTIKKPAIFPFGKTGFLLFAFIVLMLR